jgi:hypothetical protein
MNPTIIRGNAGHHVIKATEKPLTLRIFRRGQVLFLLLDNLANPRLKPAPELLPVGLLKFLLQLREQFVSNVSGLLHHGSGEPVLALTQQVKNHQADDVGGNRRIFAHLPACLDFLLQFGRNVCGNTPGVESHESEGVVLELFTCRASRAHHAFAVVMQHEGFSDNGNPGRTRSVMKKRDLLLLSLGDFGLQFFSGDLNLFLRRLDAVLLKFLGSHIEDEVTELDPLEIRQGLESDGIIFRNAGPDTDFLRHSLAHKRYELWPQLPEVARQKTHSGRKLVAFGPHKGHIGAMTRPVRNKKQTSGEAKKPDAYKAKRHKFYGEDWIAAGLDELGKINDDAGKPGTNRSELIRIWARSLLRKNAAALRAKGVNLPEDIFHKD